MQRAAARRIVFAVLLALLFQAVPARGLQACAGHLLWLQRIRLPMLADGN